MQALVNHEERLKDEMLIVLTEIFIIKNLANLIVDYLSVDQKKYVEHELSCRETQINQCRNCHMTIKSDVFRKHCKLMQFSLYGLCINCAPFVLTKESKHLEDFKRNFPRSCKECKVVIPLNIPTIPNNLKVNLIGVTYEVCEKCYYEEIYEEDSSCTVC